MYFKPLFAVLIVSLIGFSNPVQAQQPAVSRGELIELIGKLPELNGSKQALSRQGFKDDKLAIAFDHQNRLMGDKVVAGYIADRLLAVSNGNLPSGWAPDGLISPLFSSGYTNLSRGDKVFYWQVQQTVLKAMPTRECGLLVKGRMNEARTERVVGQAEARLSTSTLKRYYEIQRKAIRIGVSRGPKALSPQDAARTQEKINQTLRDRISSDPALAQVGSAFDNMNRASPANACQAGILFYDVALSLRGRDLENALLFLNE